MVRQALLCALAAASCMPVGAVTVSRGGRTTAPVTAGNQPVTGLPVLQPSQGLAGPGLGAALSPSLPSLPAPGVSGAGVPLRSGLESGLPAPSVQERVGLIQEFRRQAGLAPLPEASVALLVAEGPKAVAAAQLEAAKTLLAGVNPNFSGEVTKEDLFFDPPETLALRKAVGSARQVMAGAAVGALAEKLSTDGRIDPAAVDAAFSGSRRLASLAKSLPGPGGRALLDFIEDGAPRQAIERLGQLKKHDSRLRDPGARAAADRLVSALKEAPQSPAAAGLGERAELARRLLAKGRYGDALAEARAMLSALSVSGLREETRRFFGLQALGLDAAAREKGAAAIYGARGLMSAAALEEHVARLVTSDPGAYVGAPLSGKPTRRQCYDDCPVQQAYNHPKLSRLAEQMPYLTFLAAVESRLEDDVRHRGLMSVESAILLREFGLDMVRRGAPKSAAELVELLRRHGSLLFSVRWEPGKSLRDREGDHAVVLQGAFREDGGWNFVVIDSNRSRPQVVSFDELGVLGATGFDSVEVMKEGDPRLPEPLRSVADPAARLRLAVNAFYGRYGALRRVVPWYKAMLLAPVNFVLERLGRDPVEPSYREDLDDNLVPLTRAPAALTAAVRRGLRLPAEAFVTVPDGRRFLNRIVVKSLISPAGR
ncbi:MAG: hypothetical protein HY927_12110 [Elusimicrobia bacterium]|nr:hypothetical protein [Elusimicrobiota bacterium]